MRITGVDTDQIPVLFNLIWMLKFLKEKNSESIDDICQTSKCGEKLNVGNQSQSQQQNGIFVCNISRKPNQGFKN